MDSADFRSIMRAQAGAVAVIAAGKAGARTGLTATSACSLSDAPPTVLVCVNHSASACPVIRRERCFSVNWLSVGQDEIANHFAGRTGLQAEARFADSIWNTLRTGAPVLFDSLASLDCMLIGEHVHSTHSIFIGQVLEARLRHCEGPLLYYAGRYSSLAELHTP